MRYALVCPDEYLWTLLAGTRGPGRPPLGLVGSRQARAAIVAGGGSAVAGDLEDPAFYRHALRGMDGPVFVAVPPGRRPRVLAAVRAGVPAAPVVVLDGERRAAARLTGVSSLPLGTLARGLLESEAARTATGRRLEQIRRHLGGSDRVLILVQDDPDPDALASALALRTVLGRNRHSAPIGTFGAVSRPENRAMTRILEIEVERLGPSALGAFDAVAIVDAQPGFFATPVGEVDVVIDHHPEAAPVPARFKDIRPTYGATASILTEYLRAARVTPSQRLATALLYGIKADTRDLERGTSRADVEAFTFLHPHVNHGALRRIERPELPNRVLDALARGITRRQVVDGAVVSHVGPVAYPEVVAQFADLFLQVEGVSWSVVSGTVRGELHVSVRNVGHVRAAGDVVRQAFGDLGSAGGHRAMAKAVIRLADWRARVGPTTAGAVRRQIVQRVRRALGS